MPFLVDDKPTYSRYPEVVLDLPRGVYSPRSHVRMPDALPAEGVLVGKSRTPADLLYSGALYIVSPRFRELLLQVASDDVAMWPIKLFFNEEQGDSRQLYILSLLHRLNCMDNEACGGPIEIIPGRGELLLAPRKVILKSAQSISNHTWFSTSYPWGFFVSDYLGSKMQETSITGVKYKQI